MFGKLKSRGARLALIGDILCSFLVFPFAFAIQEQWVKTLNGLEVDVDMTLPGCMFFVAMALARLFRALRLRPASRPAFIANLVYVAAFAACAGMTLALGFDDSTALGLGMVFWAVLIAERVRAIVKKHRGWGVALNVMAILLFMLLAFSSMITFPEILLTAGGATAAFLSIMLVIFSQVKVDVLKDIVRKTYAAEIISGLLLMMVTFSYLLEFYEESIKTFWDGLWYCFAVVTTIGFGDIAAVTIVGRVLTVILGVYGIVVVALITSIIVNFYGEMKKTNPPAEADEGSTEG